MGDQFLISGSPQTTFGRIGEWASGNLQPCPVILTLTFDLLLKNLNLGHSFWTERDGLSYYTCVFLVARLFCWGGGACIPVLLYWYPLLYWVIFASRNFAKFTQQCWRFLNWRIPKCQIHNAVFVLPVKHSSTYGSLFSSPEPTEPKAQVSYCHSAPSVVRPSVRLSSVVRPSSVCKLSHFQLLLQNRLMDFDETW